MLRTFACCVTVLALAACGGGEQAAQPSGALRPVAQAQQPGADPTTGALRVFLALRGRAPTAAEFTAFASPDPAVLATSFATSLQSLSDAELATTVLANMGVTPQSVNAASYEILQVALAQYFAAYGASARGVIVNNLVGLLAGLESDATWGTAARGFNSGVSAARAVVTASTAAGGACVPMVAQGFAGNIETVQASAGEAGGDGGGGSGGGAAAGGGLGKVLGGTMTVVDLSTGNVVGQGTTDASTGLVTIRTCSLPGPFLLTLEGRAGARYFDEGKNTLLDFPAGTVLHALVDRWDEHVGVSPLTEASYQYALNNFTGNPADIASGRTALRTQGSLVGLTRAQVASANEIVRAEVNRQFTDTFQLASAKTLPTPLDAGSSSTAFGATRYGRSAAINGGLVKAAADRNSTVSRPAIKLAQDIARDLTDGRIDGFGLDGRRVSGAETGTYQSTRLPIAGSVGTHAVSGRFGTALLAGGVTLDEEAQLQVAGRGIDYQRLQLAGDNRVPCDGFADAAALLSDGTVTVLRRFPTNTAGVCRFLYNAEENERTQKMPRFLTEVKALTGNAGMLYAVKQDGTVWGWGQNDCGSLAPTLANGIHAQPQQIPELRGFTTIRASFFGGIARDERGRVVTWVAKGIGLDSAPPAGTRVCGRALFPDGSIEFTRVQDTAFVAVPEIADIGDIFTQGNAFYAIATDGTLYGWGGGVAGMLANSDGTVLGTLLVGADIERPTPLPVPPTRTLAFTGNTAFALLADGTVMGWGNDDFKLLGAGTQRRTTRPTLIPGLTNIATLDSTSTALRMLRRDGTVLALGRDVFWEPETAGDMWTPTVLTPPERIRHLVSNGNFLNVFFASGKVSRGVMSTVDVTDWYR